MKIKNNQIEEFENNDNFIGNLENFYILKELGVAQDQFNDKGGEGLILFYRTVTDKKLKIYQRYGCGDIPCISFLFNSSSLRQKKIIEKNLEFLLRFY